MPRRRLAVAITAAVVVLCALAAMPWMLDASAASLVREDAISRADVVVALSGDARGLRERRAVDLFRAGMAGELVVSGRVYRDGVDSAEAAREFVVSAGVPPGNVFELRGATNTRQEADLLARLMAAKRWRSAIVVTAPYHSRRALFTCERAAPAVRFVSSPVPARAPEWRPSRWWTRRGDAGTTLREILAWANTLAGGLQ